MSPKYHVNIAIIGGGLSGMTLAIELKKRLGVDTFTIFEQFKEVGGTWRDNTYPGCACDVPSHWYSLSTELNPEWTNKYSSQPEIQEYWKGIYQKHNLHSHMQFDSKFVKATYIEKTHGYIVDFKTSAGTTFSVACDVLVSAIGGFSTPMEKPHGMKGIDDFKGPKFHSARYDHSVELKGKRVGVIGNGCSAAQFIPIISEDKSVEVLNFCRTPNWFAPRDQKAYSALTKAIFKYVPGTMRTYRDFIAITSDSRYLAWMLRFGTLRHYVEEVMAKYIRDTAPEKYHEFLIPKYAFGCKRVIMDPGYLKCLHRSNVDIVTDPIETITEKGILGKSGKEYELDVLILGTGFDVSEGGLGLNVTGRNGRTVTEQWYEQKGPQAYLGSAISNYPNFYSIIGPNVASGSASLIAATEAQVNFIVQMIEPMVKYGVKSFECKYEAEKEYNELIQGRLQKTVWSGGCTSYYKLGNKVIATYPGPVAHFAWMARKPQWEHFVQTGGTRRMAVYKKLAQIFKLLMLMGAILTFRRLGWKKIRNESLLFSLMRYQDAMGILEKLKLKSA